MQCTSVLNSASSQRWASALSEDRNIASAREAVPWLMQRWASALSEERNSEDRW
ncbi:hypothetical protein [Lentzea sp. NEAU-D7]|uniref:hypothetical protein n=1 Tax=Lentzea sp. NEAU-D7 TaxID=2994667 RepID=UPI00224B283D|nr:hypothetical protein [Lentzea sp. NEAU-D7]MCX2948998.1 hypothetical protein [Lentzea sp. NEAU-D7]